MLSSDDDRFANHADDPNTANDGDETFALRDIHPGEKITRGYRPWGGLPAEDKAVFVEGSQGEKVVLRRSLCLVQLGLEV